jgi:hypothetical protein
MRCRVIIPSVAVVCVLACTDAYLQANLACVQNAATRAQADACRSKLHDSGVDAQVTKTDAPQVTKTAASSASVAANPDAAPTVVKTSAVDGGTTPASLQVSVIVPGDGGIPTKVDATLSSKTKPGFFSKLFHSKDGGK